MVKEYPVLKAQVPFGKLQWNDIEPLVLQSLPWGGDYAPKTKAWLLHSAEAFCLRMEALEPEEFIRAEVTGISDQVHTDSCLEFFFIPEPSQNSVYLNFEFNSTGAVHLGIGPSREERLKIWDFDLSLLQLKSHSRKESDGQTSWGFTAVIPFSLIADLLSKETYQPEKELPANFYKCGDLTPKPHYLVWNEINWPNPDYHRPEFFGRLLLEGLR